MSRFLLFVSFLAVIGLVGCDSAPGHTVSPTANVDPYCDNFPEDPECEGPGPGGGGNGGGGSGAYTLSCPAGHIDTGAYILKDDPDNQDWVEVKQTFDAFDSQGYKFFGRFVVSNNHYTSGINLAPAANAMSQLQIRCQIGGKNVWRVPTESAFPNYDVRSTVKGHSPDVDMSNGVRECFSSFDSAQASASSNWDEVHAKSNILRYPESGLWKSTHGFSSNGGSTWTDYTKNYGLGQTATAYCDFIDGIPTSEYQP